MYSEMYQSTMENNPIYMNPIAENVGDIRWLVDIAKSTKMKFFMIDRNILYGTDDEGCVLCKVEVPITISSRFIFSLTDITDALDTFSAYNNFVYIPGLALIPSDLYPKYLEGVLKFDFVSRTVSYPIDDIERPPVVLIDIMSSQYPKTNIIVSVINSFYSNICPNMINELHFDELEKNEDVVEALKAKSSDGMTVVRFEKNNRIYFITLFKSLLPLGKPDSMSLTIYDNAMHSNSFMAKFIIVKKKPRINIEYNLLCVSLV